LKELRGEHIPETEEYGISSFVFRADRPFHPERLMEVIRTGLSGVLRSKGWIWLASRPEAIGSWSLAGRSIVVDPAGMLSDLDVAELNQPRQEIVFIGVDLDAAALTASLSEALLTAQEMEGGESIWRLFPDPFPQWEIVLDEEYTDLDAASASAPRLL
jgi:G3E family GTPase